MILLETLIAWFIVMAFMMQWQSIMIHENIQIKGHQYLGLALEQLHSINEQFRLPLSQTGQVRVFQHWQMQNRSILPQAQSRYTCYQHHCQIQLEWYFNKKHSIKKITIVN